MKIEKNPTTDTILAVTPQPRIPDATLALAALIVGAILIGLAPIFVRLIDVGYTAAAFWRCALALPLLAVFGLRRVVRSGAVGGAVSGLLLTGLFFAADLAVWHQSIRLTSVANATLLANLTPVFVTLLSFVFFGERFRWAFIAGLALALMGALLLLSGSLQQRSGTAVMGDLLGIAAAMFYSGYLIGVARARDVHTTAAVMFWTTLAASIALLLLTWLLREPLWPQSLQGWTVLLGLALCSHVLGQGLIAYALAHLSTAFSAVGLLVQPVAAAVFAWVLLAEPFGARQALAGAVVLAGIVTCRLATALR